VDICDTFHWDKKGLKLLSGDVEEEILHCFWIYHTVQKQGEGKNPKENYAI
jgi:hypothetical protein